MKKEILYKYVRPDGGVTVSPNKPKRTQYTEIYRLVSEDMKKLKHRTEEDTKVVDVEDDSEWIEIEEPVEVEAEETMSQMSFTGINEDEDIMMLLLENRRLKEEIEKQRANADEIENKIEMLKMNLSMKGKLKIKETK